MQFAAQFETSGTPDEVIIRLSDVEQMARCIPGLSLEGRDSGGAYIGAITVAFGPKLLKFSGKALCEFDIQKRQGIVKGWAKTNLRGTRMQVETNFGVTESPRSSETAPHSQVSIRSEAQLSGVLASFAETGGIAVANALLAEFARTLNERIAGSTIQPMTVARPIPILTLLRSFLRALVSGLGIGKKRV